MTERKPEPPEDEHERKFRRIFAWVFFLGASVVCIIILFFAIQAAFFSHYLPYTGASVQLADFFKEHFPVLLACRSLRSSPCSLSSFFVRIQENLTSRPFAFNFAAPRGRWFFWCF